MSADAYSSAGPMCLFSCMSRAVDADPTDRVETA